GHGRRHHRGDGRVVLGDARPIRHADRLGPDGPPARPCGRTGPRPGRCLTASLVAVARPGEHRMNGGKRRRTVSSPFYAEPMVDRLDGTLDTIDDDTNDDTVAERLVDSARRLLADGGLHQVTMRSVAVGAGVSTMNVYSRFGGKDGLLDVLYREGFDTLGQRLAAIDEPDLPSQIRAFAATYRAFALEHPARYELLFGGVARNFQPS